MRASGGFFMQKNGSRFSISDYQNSKFYQLPQFLFTVPKYKSLSDGAKLAYALLKNRFEYSVQNNWIDDEGNIYFIFTNKELENIFCWGNKKVVRIKKELENVGLIDQVQCGLNKPNRLYLNKPDISACEIIKNKGTKTLGTQGSVKMTLPESNAQSTVVDTNQFSQSAKKYASALEPQGSVKTTHYIEDNIDTNIDTEKWDFSENNYSKEKLNVQNMYLTHNLSDWMASNQMFLNKRSLKLIGSWFNTPKQIQQCISIILNAKNDSLRDALNQGIDSFIDLDDEALQKDIENTLARYFNKMRLENNKIKNKQNYLYRSMVAVFDKYQNNNLMKK